MKPIERVGCWLEKRGAVCCPLVQKEKRGMHEISMMIGACIACSMATLI